MFLSLSPLIHYNIKTNSKSVLLKVNLLWYKLIKKNNTYECCFFLSGKQRFFIKKILVILLLSTFFVITHNKIFKIFKQM